MVQSSAQDNEATKSLLERASGILASFDYDRFPEVFSKDVEYRSGPAVEHGLEAFIGQLKRQHAAVPPMGMEHISERCDITDDGVAYAVGTTKITFKSHPDEPVSLPVVSVYRLVPDGQPDAGKIASLTVHKDPTPMGIKLREIM